MGLQPTVFYRWQKEFFENGVAAFEPKRPSNHSAEQERIAYLEKKIQTKDEVLAELMAEHVALKKRLGNSDRSARYAGPGRGFRPALVGEDRDQRRAVLTTGDDKCGPYPAIRRPVRLRPWSWLDITASKFYDWRERYGKVNEHNGWVPRDFWLEEWEKQAIVGFHLNNPLEGYDQGRSRIGLVIQG